MVADSTSSFYTSTKTKLIFLNLLFLVLHTTTRHKSQIHTTYANEPQSAHRW